MQAEATFSPPVPNAPIGVANPDKGGIVGLSEDDTDALYQRVGNRLFSRSTTYSLPADQEEHSRLDTQHFALKLQMNSLYPFKESVRKLLGGSAPQILDVGTGSGIWAMDIAQEYPNANVIGADLIPPTLIDKAKVPKNLHFEIADANKPMDLHTGKVDLFHARMIGGGIHDTEGWQYNIAKTLKPGGMMILCMADTQVWDENFRPVPYVEFGEQGCYGFQSILGKICIASWRNGNNALTDRLWWTEWLQANPNYTNIQEESVFVPVGPWKEGLSEEGKVAAKLMKENILRVAQNLREPLVKYGTSEEEVDTWLDVITKQLREGNERVYIKYHYWSAERTDTPFEERKPRAEPIDKRSRVLIEGLDLMTLPPIGGA